MILCLNDPRTGMKCLPASRIPQAQGIVLHDCHAEIVAIRAFNRFLIQECSTLVESHSAVSPWVRRRGVDELSNSSPQPFALKEKVSIYVYSSEAPCGDASMELIMLAQDDATPWEIPPLETEQEHATSVESALKGRGYFSELGIVRRKPGA
jgi:tRNA-specific adenosine deaminase 1